MFLVDIRECTFLIHEGEELCLANPIEMTIMVAVSNATIAMMGTHRSLLLYDVRGTHDPSTFLSNETTNSGKTRNEDKVAAHRIVQIANDILERKWLGRARMR